MTRELLDQLNCRATTDFVVAIEAPGFSEAIVTDCFGVAWRAAADLSREISTGDTAALPPREHHALLGEGGSVWMPSTGGRAQLALALLCRHEECDDSTNDRELAVLTGRRGNPVMFVATAAGLSGRRQQKEMRQASFGAVDIRSYPHRDVRGLYPRTQDPSLVRIGELLSPALLALDAVDAGLAEAS